ncbi:MAG: hypothetical protein EPN93_17430 [Spirochaetes bacterium]|nr:MAG: hypothetical protein EPN93_17430 [Spirochaetota bacterium]
MTEQLKLIEINEIKNIRVTCRRCSAALKMAVEDFKAIDKCPRCGEEYGRLRDMFIDLKNMLKNRDANDKFVVQIELDEDAR